MPSSRCVVVFTKPARAGRVKTRLIGELSAEQAAALHAAFLEDLLERLRGGRFDLRVAWALEPGERAPATDEPALRQRGGDLGERLFEALSVAARDHRFVAAVGSDHPELPLAVVENAFERLAAGAEVVLGPAADGGYYLIAVAAPVLVPALFEEIPWSTPRVLETTLERCRSVGLAAELLPAAADVDTPDDLERLAAALSAGAGGCPRTRRLLAGWGRLAGTPA